MLSSREVSGIVESAQRGNLSERIAMVGKSGFFSNLSERINGLLDTTHQSLIATSVLSRVAQGDLTRRIDRDYEGIFGQRKENDTNATVDRLVGSSGASGRLGGHQYCSQGNRFGHRVVQPDRRTGIEPAGNRKFDGRDQRYGPTECGKCSAGGRAGTKQQRTDCPQEAKWSRT